MNAPLNPAPRSRHFPAIRLIVAVVFANFLLPIAIGRSSPPVSSTLFSGFAFAELGLLSVWAVLGPQRIWHQWFASLLTLAGFVIAVTVAATISSGPGQSFRGMCVLPLLFTVVQLPLWLLRLVLGWRIVRSGVGEVADTRDSRQFGVQDLLALTAAVALMLGLARFSVSSPSDLPPEDMSAMWHAIVSIGLMLAVINTVLVPPCVWAGLRVRELSTAIAGLAGYGLLLFLLIGVILAYMSQGRGSSDAGAWILLFLAISLGLIFSVLRWAHACGYVLVTTWPKERSAKVPEGTDSAT